MFLETFLAVDRPVTIWFERDLGRTSAIGACNVMHLPRRAVIAASS